MVENLSFDDTKDHYVKFIGDCAKLKCIPHGYEIIKDKTHIKIWIELV